MSVINLLEIINKLKYIIMDQWKFAATELSILLFAIFNFDICYFEYSIFTLLQYAHERTNKE